MPRLVDQLRSDARRKPSRTKNAGRVAAGRKAAATREKKLHEAARDVPDDLIEIWDRVKWSMPYHPRRELHETFLQWVRENPEIVIAWRLKKEAEVEKQIRRFSRHCMKVYKNANRELKRKNYGTRARFSKKTIENLDECEDQLGPDWDVDAVRRSILLEATGAPF